MSRLTEEQTDDLHLLMSVAVLCSQHGVETQPMPIYDLWQAEYPQDALGNVCRGIYMIGHGNPEAGIALIETAANTATTRADQARDVLETIRAEQARTG